MMRTLTAEARDLIIRASEIAEAQGYEVEGVPAVDVLHIVLALETKEQA